MIATTEVRDSPAPLFITLTHSAIRLTVAFYKQHLLQSTSTPPALLLLSDDRGNRQKAKAEGLDACSTKDYVDQLPTDERERLVDLVAGGVDDEDGIGKQLKSKKLYDEV